MSGGSTRPGKVTVPVDDKAAKRIQEAVDLYPKEAGMCLLLFGAMCLESPEGAAGFVAQLALWASHQIEGL